MLIAPWASWVARAIPYSSGFMLTAGFTVAGYQAYDTWQRWDELSAIEVWKRGATFAGAGLGGALSKAAFNQQYLAGLRWHGRYVQQHPGTLFARLARGRNAMSKGEALLMAERLSHQQGSAGRIGSGAVDRRTGLAVDTRTVDGVCAELDAKVQLVVEGSDTRNVVLYSSKKKGLGDLPVLRCMRCRRLTREMLVPSDLEPGVFVPKTWHPTAPRWRHNLLTSLWWRSSVFSASATLATKWLEELDK